MKELTYSYYTYFLTAFNAILSLVICDISLDLSKVLGIEFNLKVLQLNLSCITDKVLLSTLS